MASVCFPIRSDRVSCGSVFTATASNESPTRPKRCCRRSASLPEERDLTPHITIGRVRSARGAEALVRALKGSGDRVFGSCRIEEVVLYRSQLRSDGAVYTPLVAIPLRGA